ncbi:MAG TPA: AzlC family ABC transporter permease, partial [Ilumatobacteraceae bacterium]|nr:AzlC family ABC transporter permease [Ilumatobacteraceae bacterium]
MVLERLDPDLRSVVTASVAVGIVIGAFGAVFGVTAVAAGGSVLQACVMSALVFTGASQFSAVSVVADGGSTAAALSSSLLLGARNGVYGLTMARVLDGPLARRLLAAQLVIDETTAMATAQTTRREQAAAFWMTGVTLYVCWLLGTLGGALLGSEIDPKRWGLDVALPAGFIAMVWPQFRTRNGRLAGVIGAVVCLVTIPFVPV